MSVKYIGVADEAVISEGDWTKAGADGQKEARWNKSNGFAIPSDFFSADALAALANDGRFVNLEEKTPEEVDPELKEHTEQLLKENSSTEDGYGTDTNIDKDPGAGPEINEDRVEAFRETQGIPKPGPRRSRP